MFAWEIPVSVSINEAVNLAKKYSQDAAPASINGILGNVSQRAAESAQQESGRGINWTRWGVLENMSGKCTRRRKKFTRCPRLTGM